MQQGAFCKREVRSDLDELDKGAHSVAMAMEVAQYVRVVEEGIVVLGPDRERAFVSQSGLGRPIREPQDAAAVVERFGTIRIQFEHSSIVG